MNNLKKFPFSPFGEKQNAKAILNDISENSASSFNLAVMALVACESSCHVWKLRKLTRRF
jgi:hypothetical protein